MISLKRLRLDEDELLGTFAAMADHVAGTAQALRDYLDDPRQPAPETHARRLELDALSTEIDRSIIESFVTPIDPDDLGQLNAALHNLGDAIDDAARLFAVLRLPGRRPDAVTLATLLTDAATPLARAVRSLDDPRSFQEANAQVNHVVREADDAFHSAIASLLGERTDALTILKWKEVFDRIKSMILMVHRATRLLHRIAVKSDS